MTRNKSMVWGLSVLTLLSCSAFAAQDSLFKTNGIGIDVGKIQSILRAKHATWTAAPNRFTGMSRADLIRHLGLNTTPTNSALFKMKRPGHHALDSTALDWRNNQGVNWVSPILDQGNCGSCVAFATIGTLETQVNITSGLPWLNPELSPQALFECGGGGCDAGWTPDGAVSFLESTGVPDEACAPYTVGATGVDVSCNSICSDSADRSTKIIGSTNPTMGGVDIDAIKSALQNGPLITTLTVYADFMSYSSGIYQHTTGDALGGHAVSIVGYDDTQRYWVIRNSWGSDWGENGFIRVSYDDDSGIGAETYGLQVAKEDGYVSIQNPIDHSFAGGALNVDVESTFTDTQTMILTLTDSSGKTYTSNCSDLTHCHVNVDTTQLADGVYVARAEADRPSGKALSAEEYFYIMNTVPTLSLSFGGADGVDLTQPLSSTINFDIKSGTGNPNIPLQYVEFHLVQNGKMLESRRANIVMPDMTLDWGTDRWPDGQYDISFVGGVVVNGKTYTVESNHYTVTTSNSGNSSLARR
jgi:C1A family cysteine protease